MQNILITGVSSGIGNYLANNLCTKYKIFGISRNDPKLDFFQILNHFGFKFVFV